jgi:hypothetical protein
MPGKDQERNEKGRCILLAFTAAVLYNHFAKKKVAFPTIPGNMHIEVEK